MSADSNRCRSQPARLAVVGVALAALTGCMTVGPDYKRPEVPLPAAWRASTPAAADVVNTAWWENFGDPELSELIKIALDANKDLLIAAHRIEQLDARLQVSQSASMPQVGYNTGVERKQRSEEQPALLAPGRSASYNNHAVNGTLSWEFDIWGKVARANESARADLLAAEETRRTVMLKVATGVAFAYVQLLSRDHQLELTRQAAANRREAVALLDIRYKGGSGTLIEVVKARAAAEETESTIAPIERDIVQIENALSALLARNPGPIKRRKLEQLKMPPVPQGVPSDVLARRPDVLAAEQTLVSANAQIGVAKSQYFPTISLTSALGLASDQLQWLLARTARTSDVSVGLVGTLFSGGRIEGDIRAAEALQKLMAQTYLQAVQTALQEVEDALIARAKAGEQVAVLEQRVKTMRDLVKLSELRFEGGRSTALDVLDSSFQLLGAQGFLAQGLREQYGALVGIYKAMGGGWMVEQQNLRSPSKVTGVDATAPSQQTAKAHEVGNRQ